MEDAFDFFAFTVADLEDSITVETCTFCFGFELRDFGFELAWICDSSGGITREMGVGEVGDISIE